VGDGLVPALRTFVAFRLSWCSVAFILLALSALETDGSKCPSIGKTGAPPSVRSVPRDLMAFYFPDLLAMDWVVDSVLLGRQSSDLSAPFCT
jgi:hypothetical protein